MKKGMLLGIVLFAMVLLSGCELVAIQGKGPVVAKEYPLAGFSGVDVSNAMKVVVKKGERFQVTVRIRQNLLPYLEVDKRGDVLHVGMQSGHNYSNLGAEVLVVMPELRSFTLSGACEGVLEGEWQVPDIQVSLSGASSLKGTVAAEDGKIEVSGASSVALNGSARSLVAEASGASRLDMRGFTVDRLRVELSGASHGEMQVVKSLDAEASGASSFDYTGDPSIERSDTSGASSINRR
ncbi:MAG: DUF2807 domain-containing protein [Acidobacteria bacterium]|nr:DUF2807 domain-containing protein [Acidobacteriota bacterium]